MKTTFLQFILALAMAGCFIGCYKPHGEYFNDINIPDSVILNINLNPSDSIIYIFELAEISYDILLEDKKFLRAEFYVDNELIKAQVQTPGSVQIDPEQFSTGEHNIHLILYTSSGTGSLAEAMGAEALVFEYSWKAIMETAEPVALETNIVPENGRLKISWEKYNKANFHYYKLIRIWNIHPLPNLADEIKIFDQDQTWYIDSTYIGGKAHYKLVLYVHGHSQSGSTGYTQIDYEEPALEISADENYHFSFQWNTCEFYNNLSKYELLNVDVEDSVIFTTTNPEQISFGLPGGLYPSYHYKLKWVSENSHSLRDKALEEKETFFAGYQLSPWYDPVDCAADYPPKIYFQLINDIVRYNATLSKEQYTYYNAEPFCISVSPNNLHLVQSNFDYQSIRIFNTDDFSDFQDIDLIDVVGYQTKMYRFDIANNGILVGFLADGTILGYDLNTNESVFTLNNVQNPAESDIKISSSGNYFITHELPGYNAYLYQIAGTIADPPEYLGNDFRNIHFINNEDTDQFYAITTDQEVKIFNCTDIALQRSFDSESENIFNVDPVSGLLFASNHTTNSYQVYNFETGEKVLDYLTDETFDNCIILNSILYTGNRYYPLYF